MPLYFQFGFIAINLETKQYNFSLKACYENVIINFYKQLFLSHSLPSISSIFLSTKLRGPFSTFSYSRVESLANLSNPSFFLPTKNIKNLYPKSLVLWSPQAMAYYYLLMETHCFSAIYLYTPITLSLICSPLPYMITPSFSR